MRYEGANFVINQYPPVTSDYWKKPVQELADQLAYFDEASSDLRNNIWPQCARAYFCRRDLPEFESMKLIDNSPLGETDIWDSINFLTDAIMNAQMPRDQSYIELLAYDAEDQGKLNDVRDLLQSVHRRADTRSQYSKHVKQALIYGTSALWWHWKKTTKMVRKGLAEATMLLRRELPNAPMETIVKLAKKALFPKDVFNGPVIRPIDMYDFWIDPTADMSRQADFPIVTRFYATLDELKEAVDEDGEKRYGNLDRVEEKSIDSIYNGQEERLLIINELGISPLAGSRSGVKLVPVYVFHAPVRKFSSDKGQTFVDCFFYIAEAAKGDDWVLLRVEDSPYPNGSRGIYIDTYVDWTSGGYGIGAVEKSVNAWEYKNLLSALGLQQQVMVVAPMYSVVTDALYDESKLKLGPGGVTLIKKGGAGHDFIRPIPTAPEKVQIGQSLEQWYGQKILGQMQAYGAIMQDPTKSIKSAKTATQINTESTSGSVVRDNFLEKMVLRSLQPLMQDVYDAARIYLNDPVINFEKSSEGQIQLGRIEQEDFDRDRMVIVTGYHGLVNKAKEMEEMQQAFQIFTTGNVLEHLPNLSPALQELVIKILGRLGLKNLDKLKEDPTMLLLRDPQIQAKLMQDPNFQKLIQQMAQTVAQGGPIESGPEATATQNVSESGASFGGQPINLDGPQGAGPEETGEPTGMDLAA